jgi:hypothetical protein
MLPGKMATVCPLMMHARIPTAIQLMHTIISRDWKVTLECILIEIAVGITEANQSLDLASSNGPAF